MQDRAQIMEKLNLDPASMTEAANAVIMDRFPDGKITTDNLFMALYDAMLCGAAIALKKFEQETFNGGNQN